MSGISGDTCRTGAPFSGARRCRCAVGRALALAGVLLASGSAAWSAPRVRDLPSDEPELAEPEQLKPEDDIHPLKLKTTSLDEAAALKDVVVEITVEGNPTIPNDAILKHVKSNIGRPLDQKAVKEDVKELHKTSWFVTIEPVVRKTEKGLVLVFRVRERPILRRIEYKGNKKIKTKELEALTNLKVGGAFDVNTNREAARRIEEHYREKSFQFAKVTLEKGNQRNDREVVFLIEEGHKVHVGQIAFEGNKFFSTSLLKTKLRTKERMFWFFGGTFDPANQEEDVGLIKQYYQSLGFFDVQATVSTVTSEDQSKVNVTYKVVEGIRYKVRDVSIEGNKVISDKDLLKDMKVASNEYFNEKKLEADKSKVTNQYGELGRIFARIDVKQIHLEEPGFVDLVYAIDEDRPYRIRRINVHIDGDNPHTKESVVINRLLLKPGDLANADKIKKSETRVKGSALFAGAQPGSPDGPHIAIVQGQAGPRVASRERSHIVRAQGFQDDPNSGQPPGAGTGGENDEEMFDPLDDSMSRALAEPPEGMIDLDVDVKDTQTGRFMFGVGVNSNAGLLGNITLDENNFDISRVPTSYQDIKNGTAFRGGGQQFRLEAMPGTIFSRYLASWTDPYFLDRNVSLSTMAQYYNRYFPNWVEQREGGRVSLGKLLTPYLSTSLAVRAENVNISYPSVPTPPSLEAVLGNSVLSTVEWSVAHDTRDSAFQAGHGHYLNAKVEQGMADYVYTKYDLDARQYFTLRERPDGSGRHTLSVTGLAGYTGSNTPIFEKFFAGGYQSFRGFQFYGVTPMQEGVRIGGTFQALGSVEYMFPIMADDTIKFVTFSDFGTVDNSVSFNAFRLTVGAGIRLTIPAMGPAPIALDWAIPVMQQSYDTTQLFSFYVGVQR